jgi:opacity protein-like surface antigen
VKALRLGGAVLGALVFACPALAADLPVKARPSAAVPIPVSWTGFYVGGSIGGRWAEPVWTTTCLIPGFRLSILIDPNVLLFATGGASWTRLEATAFCGTDFHVGGWCDARSILFFGTASTLSKILTGWTAGGGIEWMLAPHWLVRGEYRYADYGRLSGTFFPGFGGFVVNGDAIAADVKLRTHTALFGIAYRFGG